MSNTGAVAVIAYILSYTVLFIVWTWRNRTAMIHSSFTERALMTLIFALLPAGVLIGAGFLVHQHTASGNTNLECLDGDSPDCLKVLVADDGSAMWRSDGELQHNSNDDDGNRVKIITTGDGSGSVETVDKFYTWLWVTDDTPHAREVTITVPDINLDRMKDGE